MSKYNLRKGVPEWFDISKYCTKDLELHDWYHNLYLRRRLLNLICSIESSVPCGCKEYDCDYCRVTDEIEGTYKYIQRNPVARKAKLDVIKKARLDVGICEDSYGISGINYFDLMTIKARFDRAELYDSEVQYNYDPDPDIPCRNDPIIQFDHYEEKKQRVFFEYALNEKRFKPMEFEGGARYIKVNMNASDQTLKDDFSRWLEKERIKKKNPYGRKIKINPSIFKKWTEDKILAYIDLVISEKITRIDITNSSIGHALDPNGGIEADLEEKVRITIHSRAKEAISDARLYMLATELSKKYYLVLPPSK